MANTAATNFIVTTTNLRTEGNQVFLSVDASLDDIDGIGLIRYQWQRGDGAGGWSDITDATSTSYVLTDADVGFTVRTMAYYVDGGGTTEIAYSQPSSTILNVNDAPTGKPVIAGLLVEDSTVSAVLSAISDQDGLPSYSTFLYQWQRSADGGTTWSDISGATSQSYTLLELDSTARMRVVVSYVDLHGTTETIYSSAGLVSNVNDAPVGFGVSIGGSATEGATLTASASVTSDEDGLPSPLTFTYKWQSSSDGVNWSNVAGATSASLALNDAEVGKQFRMVTSYTDGHGTTETTTSSATAAIANVNDLPTGSPRILAALDENYFERRSSTYFLDNQFAPDIASLKDGGWVIIWQSYGQDGSLDGIFGQRYQSNGAVFGAEFQINSYSNSEQFDPSITGLADGGWLVTWTSSGQDGFQQGIFGQRYSSNGIKVGFEFQVNTRSFDIQDSSSVIALENGGWVVVWVSRPFIGTGQDGWGAGIFGQKYSSSGNKVGDEFRVNSSTDRDQINPSIVKLADGGWLVVWDNIYFKSHSSVSGQRYSADGILIGSEFGIASAPYSSVPVTTALQDGGWLITWHGNWVDGNESVDGYYDIGVWAQRYSSIGNKEGSAFKVDETVTNSDYHPSITVLIDGGWIITWEANINGGVEILGQRYDGSGTKMGGAFIVNAWNAVASSQTYPVATSLPNGGWVIAWSSNGQDGSGSGIYSQLYDVNGNTGYSSYPIGNVASASDFIENRTLYADSSLIIDADGVGVVSWQWQRSGDGGVSWSDITGATSSSYALGDADAGRQVRLKGTNIDGQGTIETVYSAASTAVINVNDAPVGFAVTISGTAAEDATLTANASVTSDADGLPEPLIFTYQWQSSSNGSTWTNITGATSASFTPGDAEVARQLRVVTTYTDGQGTTETTTSTATATIANINDLPSGFTVAINGTRTEDQVLTASIGAIGDADGVGVLTYQWQRSNDLGSWDNISGANSASFTLGENDISRQIRLQVSYVDGNGTTETKYSGATLPIANVDDEATIQIGKSGSVSEGSTLSANVTASDVDGAITSTSCQWQVSANGSTGWTNIAGATSASFVIVSDQSLVGKYLRLAVTTEDARGGTTTATTDWGSVANVNDAPVGFGVSIGGSATEGATLTASASVTSDEDGLPSPLTFTYKWQSSSDGSTWTNITGATSASFTPGDAEVARQLRVVTTYTDGQGTTETTTSTATTAVVNINDAPVITSNSGGATAAVSIAENTTAVTTVTATDADASTTLTYNISGGADAALFQINAATGALSFKAAPNFEAPGDGGANNVYDVVVQVSDGTLTDTQTIAVTITDVDDTSPAVSLITYGTNDGALAVGETVTLSVTLSEAVNVTGTPTLALSNGGVATYTGGSGTTALTFSYTAAAGQTTADLATAASNALTGTIADLAGNAVTAAGFNNVNPTGTLAVDSKPFITVMEDKPAEVFLVNTYTSNGQVYSSVAALNDGGWIVTWMSQGQDSTPGWGIYGQRYGAAGNAVGSEILIREDPYSSVEHPQAIGLKDGGWIAVWTVQSNSNGLVKIESQRFDSDGYAINGISTIFQSYGPWPDWPQVTALSDGGWIVVAPNMGQGQRYNANGDLVSYVSQPGTNHAMSMAILADDGWIITYTVSSDGSGNGVSGQRYDSSGTAIGSQFRINTYTNNDQFKPLVSSLNDGGWVVVWVSNGQDGSYLGIYGQIYNSSGNKVGSEFRVNTTTLGNQGSQSSYVTSHDIVTLLDGSWVVAWSTDSGIYGQRYESNGAKIGVEFQLLNVSSPSMAALLGGGWIVTGGIGDIYGQHFDSSGNKAYTYDITPPTVSSVSYGANDGALALGETVTLTVTFSEAVNVTGTPTLALANGGTATYSGGTGTNTLTFSYTPAAGQTTSDLATASSNALTGTITDLAGNAVTSAGFNNINPTGTLAVDMTVPTVSTFSPTDGSTGITVGSNIALTFSEAIARGTGNITLRSGSATGTIVESFDAASSNRLTLSGSTLTIDPTSDLSANTQYFVVFTSGNIKDTAGNAYAGISTYDFRTAADTTAPAFTSATTSADGFKVILSYNEPLRATTAAKTAFAVKVAGVTATVSSVAVSGSNIELTLATSIGAGQTVTVGYTAPTASTSTTNAAVQDAGGNDAPTLSADTAVTNISTADKVAPVVSTFSPTDGSSGITVGSNIALTFSEAIARGTGNITLRSGSATGTIVESFAAASSNRLTLSGSTLTIDPTSDLASDTKYFVVLTSGNIKDAAGNAYVGISTYDFRTADITPPTVSMYTPNGGMVGVRVNTNIEFTFSEAIARGTGNITLRSGSATGTIVESFDAATSNRLTLSGSTLTIDPTGDLSTDTTYFVVFTSGNIKDIAGNANAETSTFFFRTLDTIAPTVRSIAYGGNDGVLALGESVRLTVALSEAVFVTGTPTLALANGGTATFIGDPNGSVSYTQELIFIYTPSAGQSTPDLATAESDALIGIIRDPSGNAVTAAGFNNVNPTGTLAVDVTGPTVSTFSPTDGSSAITVGSNIALTFSEAIARGTGNITLRSGSATGTIVESFDAASSNRLTVSGSTLTIDPTNNLSANTLYFVVFTSGNIKDTVGNAYAGISTYDFRTANILNGTANNDTQTGTVNADTINGLAGNDIITGGAGADTMTGGTGADTFVFAAGASGTPSVTNFDVITDFASVSDVIDYAVAITIETGGATTNAGTALISASGIATFNADDDTLAERITATQAAIALGTNVAGEAAAFMFGSDAYMFISDGVAGVGANDVLIKLTVVDLVSTAFDLMSINGAGNVTFA